MLTEKELSKILNNNGGILLDTIPIERIQNYLELKDKYQATNVLEDTEFQQQFLKIQEISGVGVNEEFIRRYFDIMEGHKKREGLVDFRVTCRAVFGANPKKKLTSTQFSQLTKMANVINPKYPSYDGPIADLYGFDKPVQTKLDSRERLNVYLEFYRYMGDLYQQMLDSGSIKDLIIVFKIKLREHGDYPMTPVKRVDLLVKTAAHLKAAGKLI